MTDRTPTGDLRDQTAEALPCPVCPAQAGEPCHRAREGNQQPHMSRLLRADAVLPVAGAERKRAIETERAAITKGVREYFAPVDDPLFEDVEVLCGRIERGEYGTA